MPAPPFPTNLLLRKIFAGTLILPQSRRQHKCWTTRHRLGGARRTPPRSRNGTLHVPFPSSKAVKAPPGLCQESAFSPLNITPKTLRLFLETRRRSQGDDASSAQQMRAKQTIISSAQQMRARRGERKSRTARLRTEQDKAKRFPTLASSAQQMRARQGERGFADRSFQDSRKSHTARLRTEQDKAREENLRELTKR